MLTLGLSRAVVCALSQGNHQGDSSLVYCLPLESVGSDEGAVRVAGEPFQLHNQSGRYIWANDQLRKEKISRGTVISFVNFRSVFYYSGNTEMEMDMNIVLSQLKFVDQGGVVYRGINDAFSNSEIRTKGIYVEQDDDYVLALISIRAAKTVDGRVLFQTRQEEELECNLKNNCRSTKQNTIEEVVLPVGVPLSEKNVGSVVLLKAGAANQAVCEGIMLNSANSEESMTDILELPSYKMTSNPRGKCVIINNVSFQDKAFNRVGAEHDEKVLKDLFKKELGFDVDIRKDLPRDEMWKVAKDVASQDHSKFDAFVFAIMSHGGNNDALDGVDGRPLNIEDVMMEFKAIHCPSLQNKPKVFLIQCCRGTRTEFISPGNRHSDSCVPTFQHDSTLAKGASPQEADFLLAHASSPGYFSYRYPESGSTFIQVLVDVIKQHHQHLHLIEMLTEVTRQVVERSMAADHKMPRVQVPAYSSTLRAKLFL